MKKTIKIGIAVLVGILLVLSGIYYFLQGERVEVFEVTEKGELKETVKETGIVSAQDIIVISPAFDGRIDYIVEQGKVVKKGELIATLDVKDLALGIKQLELQISALESQRKSSGITNPKQQEIHSQEIQIDRAKKDLEKAKLDYENALILFQAGALSKTELDNLQIINEKLVDQISILESSLISMKNNSRATEAYYNSQINLVKAQKESLLDKKTSAEIFSPVDGIVTSSGFKKGTMVSVISPILEISNTKNFIVKATLTAKIASELKVGDKVEITKNTQNTQENFIGTISNISSFATTEISSLGIPEQKMQIEIASEKLQSIPLGYKLDLELTTISKNDVIGIPKLSVFKKDGKNNVLKVVNNKVVFQEVELGIETSDRVEILSGVDGGDIIIVDPNNQNLKEGKAVNYEKTKE